MARNKAEDATTASMGGTQQMAAPEETFADAQTVTGVVVPAEVGTIATAGPAIRTLVEWLESQVSGGDADPFAGLESMIRQVFEADTPADVLKERIPVSGKSFLRKPFVLNGFSVTRSEFSEGDGCPYYLNLQATDERTGETVVINIGSWIVCAQVAALVNADSLPVRCEIREKDKPTSKGFYPLRLHMPE